MIEQNITIQTQSFKPEELEPNDADLVNRALEAAKHAYAPYSHFSVGAAVLLKSGEVVTGSNQENAAYPSGLCAERTALFYAGARYPDDPVELLAIAAYGTDGTQTEAISPCGGCRQVMIEVATRFGEGFPVLLAGKNKVTKVPDCRALLPLQFDESSL